MRIINFALYNDKTCYSYTVGWTHFVLYRKRNDLICMHELLLFNDCACNWLQLRVVVGGSIRCSNTLRTLSIHNWLCTYKTFLRIMTITVLLACKSFFCISVGTYLWLGGGGVSPSGPSTLHVTLGVTQLQLCSEYIWAVHEADIDCSSCMW